MFRLLKILGFVPTGSPSSVLTAKLKMMPIRSKAGSSKSSSCSPSKSSSCSHSKSKSSDKPQPSCKRSARKKNCSKVPAPSPSYSECRRRPTAPKPFKECDCGDFDKC